MHLLETLQDEIIRDYPDAKASLDRPLRPDGVWTLDVVRGEKWFIVEWFADDKIGLSDGKEDQGYGTGPDELLTSIDALRTKLEVALA